MVEDHQHKENPESSGGNREEIDGNHVLHAPWFGKILIKLLWPLSKAQSEAISLRTDIGILFKQGPSYEQQPGTDRLLVVDQWEELYTLAGERTERPFVGGLFRTIETAPLSVVLTLRGDFFGRALAQRTLADQLQDAV
jgi:hypothetical protein